jgi:hypothetical protein
MILSILCFLIIGDCVAVYFFEPLIIPAIAGYELTPTSGASLCVTAGMMYVAVLNVAIMAASIWLAKVVAGGRVTPPVFTEPY